MKLTFSREEIVTRTYEMSVARFMEQAFREAQISKWDGVTYLQVCIPSGTKSDHVTIVYTIPLKPNEEKLDFYDKKNVKCVLTRYLKEKQE